MRHTISCALLPVLAAILLVGCDTFAGQTSDSTMVVEAFLYTGRPVDDVRLTWAVPLSSADSIEAPVNDAAVRLVRGTEEYDLVATGVDGYYRYPGSDLLIGAGDVFDLIVDRDDVHIEARTAVPGEPTGVQISDSILEVPTLGAGGGFPGGGPPGGPGGGLQDNAVTISWENAASDLHYVVIESLTEGEPEYILPEFIRERFMGFRLVTPPTRLNVYDIQVRSLEVLGRHRATVYRVNREYEDLYANRQQDSRDLNEPTSNIRGGLGIFSAFNGVNIEFDVRSAE